MGAYLLLWADAHAPSGDIGVSMASDNPLEKFENKTRLLSNDEKELIGVLARFYEHIASLTERVDRLEAAQASRDALSEIVVKEH